MTSGDETPTTIQVGILTKGRPMLAMVIANLVLQEEHPIEIFIVDTGDQPHYSPRGVLGQDEIVRNILLEYYNNNSDVLDAKGPRERVWELEFLTELFPTLGRVTEVQQETVSYHLDYGGNTRWDLMEEALLATTRRELNRLVAKYAPATTPT